MMVKEPLKIGQVIMLTKIDIEGYLKTKTQVPYTVIGVYAHHVLLADKKGLKRSITNAELMTMGYVEQKR